MAAIVERKKRYAVVYYKHFKNEDSEDETRQVWETFQTMEDAERRKDQVEYLQRYGFEKMPDIVTVRDLMDEFVRVYGVNHWAFSTYQGKVGMIDNYINPTFGHVKLQDINPYSMELFYQSLRKVKAVSKKNRKAATEYITEHTISEIWKLLRTAFEQAVRWGLMETNPAVGIKACCRKNEELEIWTPEEFMVAADSCTDSILSLAMHLSFACSLRIGELLGLRWKNIHISESDYESRTLRLDIECELQRVNRDILEKIGTRDILFIFPVLIKATNTQLVLKVPKTERSRRTVFLPESVAKMLQERKATIQQEKKQFQSDYADYDLVFCNSIGRPIERSYIDRAFSKFIKENSLRKVVFHSIRHTSITCKLKLTGGDLKAVQGDSGHAGLKMIEDVYSHILDGDRIKTAQILEDVYYSKKRQPEDVYESGITEAEIYPGDQNQIDLDELMEIFSHPEILILIRSLLEERKNHTPT